MPYWLLRLRGYPDGSQVSGRYRDRVHYVGLELKLGPIDIAETVEGIGPKGKPKAGSVGGMHGAIRTDVKGLVKELPHHRHVALRDFEDVAVGGRHGDVHAGGKENAT